MEMRTVLWLNLPFQSVIKKQLRIRQGTGKDLLRFSLYNELINKRYEGEEIR